MRIILADDDDGVRESLGAIVQTLPDSEVRLAATGGEALQQATAMEGVDLLITDVVMEPMDGFTLRDQIARRYPAARTVFITGFDLSDYAAQIGGAPVLMKPVDQPTLLAAIEQEFAAAQSAAETAAAPPSPTAAGTVFIGQTIGAYQIHALLGQSRWGNIYAAVQTSINRPVGLKILDPARAGDENARNRFLGDARAKAHVQHPAILAVYEAGETEGQIFYTQEYVDGSSLADLQARQERVDEPTGLKILKAVAEGLNYLQTSRIAHSPPSATGIYLGNDGHPRLANLATQVADEQLSIADELQVVGRALFAVVPSGEALSPGLRSLLGRMVQIGPQSLNSWSGVIQGVKALEPKFVPVEAAKISAQDRAAIAAVEAARKAQKRALYLSIGSLVSLLLLIAFFAWKFLHSNERKLDQQVHIPAGSFTFGTGEIVSLPDFWIDKYEVTIGQYAKFVEYLEGHPTTEYDHERQPKVKAQKMHKPNDWAVYYGRARGGQPIHQVPSDLNMPAIMVDWWDAYAYAKWKGRELPTEQEWEKAARGSIGLVYPWGNEFDPKKVNANADFVMNDPGAPGKIDGFNYWGPVDQQRDKSPFGVFGMAGNVSEWTATWTADKRHPILKGGSYMSSDVRLDRRVDNAVPSTMQENIGFRTVSHQPPQ